MSIFPIKWEADFLKNLNISMRKLDELESLGLIKRENGCRFLNWNFDTNHLVYGGRAFTFKTTRSELPIGDVKLTDAGKCLARYIENEPIAGYIEYLKENWSGVTFEETATVRMKTDENGEMKLVRI